MQNRIIPVSLAVTRVSLILAVSMYLFLIGIVVFWHFDPAYFDHWYISTPFHAGAANFNIHKSPVGMAMNLNDIGTPMIYWLVIRTSFFFFLVFLALKKVSEILTSVKNKGAFQQDSIRLFKQLAIIGAIYALNYSFNFSSINGQTAYHFKLPSQPLLFAIACLVLSGIFQEGVRLNEDSNSII